MRFRLLSKRRFLLLVGVLVLYLLSVLLVLHRTVTFMEHSKMIEQETALLPVLVTSLRQDVDNFSHVILGSTSLNLTFDNDLDQIRPPLQFYNNTEIQDGGQQTWEKVDWNDYDLMAREATRQGPGEHGQGFPTSRLQEPEKKLCEELRAKYKFNAFASDRIAFDRSIGDIRTDVCKKKLFIKNIPENSVSIISIFYNEKNSTLIRTIHSLVNRSPKKLLREIILVDDCSSDEELKAPLDAYLQTNFPAVRLIRNKDRIGLIKSRIVGADASTGSFLLFLDAHTEVNYNYLPAMLEPIVMDYRTVVCPMIDIISDENHMIRPLIERERGAFDWSMSYQRLPVFQEDQSEPHPVPTMVGCAMAISRQWWEELGKYDSGLDIWGGEQYEISFKSWQCGGKVVDAPCSRVAHLFRKLPYASLLMDKKIDDRNLLRVASVWMDEYKEYLVQRRPVMKTIDPGDLTEQRAVRERLKCKSFDWYMHEVAPDILHFFPPIDPPIMASGRLMSKHNSDLCVVTKTQGFNLDLCNKSVAGRYEYDWRLHIRTYGQCFANPGGRYIFMYTCLVFEHRLTQGFVWNQTSGKIVNVFTHSCIDYDPATLDLLMAPCNASSPTQSWTFDHFNATLVDNTWEANKASLGLNATNV
ncbi:polypeptide N-acetylgalactosaminyltransferase-like 6 [Physella acuta]|uniref:polypeptide N-acetylgalactosaminyltransferase-like 6 n=1 Tax=Physella acuta TaxID=109671 RepID=UPI0027DC451B|nr:polypeptide N-acetylgalactosaminyltransferase-like 6 [Physella acuta]